ncbi:phosphotransferase [Paractinoplanes atraurantiacus]|uniref:Spectinomycin phosphotransferase n=1 Tax=Paractinoplanes atraurantiacus TaxID=1036182 RepID=A0A285KS73_9ACTN|nr:aminoglycoside phosphotransferase family protein [Actinoplanes atraurantiacus]SNY74246.1 spectinomycin phosphotransferase [Actinoplanes atraurantiacus]
MREQPADLTDSDVAGALAAGWGINAPTVRYLPVGAGGHHWSAPPWFVTVTAYSPALEQALDTAARLELDFVVAAIRTLDGTMVHRLGDDRAVAVHPFVSGSTGSFGPHPAADRESVLDLLIALHEATVPAPRTDLRLPGRGALESALAGLDRPWISGPYAEPARRLLAEHAAEVTARLARFDTLRAALPPPDSWVVTHGEPHPGNVLRTPAGPLLIDWDTVRLAPPERDLWMLTEAMIDAPPSPDISLLSRYEKETGRSVSSAAVDFYRNMWILMDIAAYTDDLRRPHTEGADLAAALDYLAANLRSA